MLQPKQDYMILLKMEKNSIIQLPDNIESKEAKNLQPFKIVSIGPGYWEHGTFIKTTHKPGDTVFVTGTIKVKHDDVPILFARERDVVFQLA